MKMIVIAAALAVCSAATLAGKDPAIPGGGQAPPVNFETVERHAMGPEEIKFVFSGTLSAILTWQEGRDGPVRIPTWFNGAQRKACMETARGLSVPVRIEEAAGHAGGQQCRPFGYGLAQGCNSDNGFGFHHAAEDVFTQFTRAMAQIAEARSGSGAVVQIPAGLRSWQRKQCFETAGALRVMVALEPPTAMTCKSDRSCAGGFGLHSQAGHMDRSARAAQTSMIFSFTVRNLFLAGQAKDHANFVVPAQLDLVQQHACFALAKKFGIPAKVAPAVFVGGKFHPYRIVHVRGGTGPAVLLNFTGAKDITPKVFYKIMEAAGAELGSSPFKVVFTTPKQRKDGDETREALQRLCAGSGVVPVEVAEADVKDVPPVEVKE